MVGSAHAEMIPQTPSAKAMLENVLADPSAEMTRALHALPEKVYFTDQPGVLEKLAGAGKGNLLGMFRPTMGTNYSLFIDPKAHASLSPEELRNTIEHEAAHGLAQISGIGGVRQPTGIGAIDMFTNIPFARISEAGNEQLADILSGLKKDPKQREELMKQIMKRKVK